MTKEQIEKHRDVIKWFCDNPDKGVWFKSNTDKWIHTDCPKFYGDTIYAQNDEYVELRKALADGKTIQKSKRHYCLDFWDDVDAIYTHYHVTKYRIKPEEPKFKVGDWVRFDSHNAQVTETDLLHDTEHLVKWQPKEGEWCVFWGANTEVFTISKYGCKPLTASKHRDSYGNMYDYVAPLESIDTLNDEHV